jgi:hypothetical protein
VILTDEPDAVEGKTLDQFEPDGEYLFEMPQSYGFRNDYEFIGNGVSLVLIEF